MASEVARHFHIHPKKFSFVRLEELRTTPMSRITAGIRDAADDIIKEFDGAKAFQEAILTSDTCTKSCSAIIPASIGEILSEE